MITPLPGVTPTVPGSCTLPLPGIIAAIVDETGHDVANGHGGILVIKRPWPAMIRTIWGDPERYKKSYYPEELGGKLYLAGDGAVRDKTTTNFMIMGRIDDVLNVSGHRLGTMEIESALVANPMVAEAAVVGRPDDMTGEAVCAFVVLKQARPSGDRGREDREGAARLGRQGDRSDREAQGHPLRRQPAEDPLRQDHAPAAALDRQGRGDHAGRVDAGESGDPRSAEAGAVTGMRTARGDLRERPSIDTLSGCGSSSCSSRSRCSRCWPGMLYVLTRGFGQDPRPTSSIAMLETVACLRHAVPAGSRRSSIVDRHLPLVAFCGLLGYRRLDDVRDPNACMGAGLPWPMPAARLTRMRPHRAAGISIRWPPGACCSGGANARSSTTRRCSRVDPDDTAGAGLDRASSRAARSQARSARDSSTAASLRARRRRGPFQSRLPAAGAERSRRRRWRHSSAQSPSIPTTIARYYGLGAVAHLAAAPGRGAGRRSRKNTKLQPMSPYGWYQLARVQHELGRTDEDAEGARPTGQVRAEGRARSWSGRPGLGPRTLS